MMHPLLHIADMRVRPTKDCSWLIKITSHGKDRVRHSDLLMVATLALASCLPKTYVPRTDIAECPLL